MHSGHREDELERLAEDLKAHVRTLQQQLLHPEGEVSERSNLRDRIAQLQAELRSTAKERDDERAHARSLERQTQELQVPSKLLMLPSHKIQAASSFWIFCNRIAVQRCSCCSFVVFTL